MTKNYINSCTINLHHQEGSLANSEAVAYSNKIYQEHILPNIQSLLNKYQTYHIVIPQINIDVGKIKAENIGKAVYNALEKQLIEHIEQGQANNTTLNKTAPEHYSLHGIEANAQALQTLQSFLDYIIFPQQSWTAQAQAHTFDIQHIAQEATQLCLNNKQALQLWLHITQQYKNALERSIVLIPKNLRWQLIQALIDTYTNTSTDTFFTQQIQLIHSLRQALEAEHHEITAAFLHYVAAHIQNISPSTPLFHKAPPSLFQQKISPKSWLTISSYFTSHASPNIAVPNKETTAIKHTDKADLVNSSKPQQTTNKNTTKRQTTDKQSRQKQTGTESETETYNNTKDNKIDIYPQQRLPIYNAGLILLHPMLSSFFSNTALLNKERKFVSAETQRRAALLLQYLCGPPHTYHEHLIHLNKILCHLPINSPIEDNFYPSPAEEKESRDLLHAFTKHWTSIKNSSIESIQQSFFRRPGLLEQSGDDWIIRIETQGMDILLEGLPWQIEQFSLAWSNSLFFIDWKHP